MRGQPFKVPVMRICPPSWYMLKETSIAQASKQGIKYEEKRMFESVELIAYLELCQPV